MAGLVLLTTSCVLAPDIETEEETLNAAPEILLDSMRPPNTGSLLKYDADCPRATFEVGQVRDRNVKDELYIAWFPDWNIGWDKEPDSWTLLAPTNEEIRLGHSKTLDIGELVRTTDNFHTLRVFVVDRSPKVTAQVGITFPFNPEGGFATYEWTFLVTEPGTGNCEQGDGP